MDNNTNKLLDKLTHKKPALTRCKSCGALHRADTGNVLKLTPRLIHALVGALKSGVVNSEQYDLQELGMAERKKKHSSSETSKIQQDGKASLQRAIQHLRAREIDKANEAIRAYQRTEYDKKAKIVVLTELGKAVANTFVKEATRKQ